MNEQQINIPISAFADFVCDFQDTDSSWRCKSKEFVKVLRLKTYKGLLSQGNRLVMEVPVFQCVRCGAIHELLNVP